MQCCVNMFYVSIFALDAVCFKDVLTVLAYLSILFG